MWNQTNNIWRPCQTLHQCDFTKLSTQNLMSSVIFFSLYSSIIPFLLWRHHLPLTSSTAFCFHLHHIHVHPLSVFVQRVVLRVFPQTYGAIPLSEHGREKKQQWVQCWCTTLKNFFICIIFGAATNDYSDQLWVLKNAGIGKVMQFVMDRSLTWLFHVVIMTGRKTKCSLTYY